MHDHFRSSSAPVQSARSWQSCHKRAVLWLLVMVYSPFCSMQHWDCLQVSKRGGLRHDGGAEATHAMAMPLRRR